MADAQLGTMGPRLFLGRVNDQLPFPIRFPFFMHIADQSQPVPADPGVIQAGGIRLGPVIVRQQTIAGFELKLKLRPTIPGKASMNRLMQGKGSRSSSRPTFGKAMRPFAPVPAVGEGSVDARHVRATVATTIAPWRHETAFAQLPVQQFSTTSTGSSWNENVVGSNSGQETCITSLRHAEGWPRP